MPLEQQYFQIKMSDSNKILKRIKNFGWVLDKSNDITILDNMFNTFNMQNHSDL